MDKKFLIVIGIIAGLIVAGLILFWTIGRPEPAKNELPKTGAFPSAAGRLPGQATAGGPTAPSQIIQPGQQKPLTQLTQKAVSGATFIPSSVPPSGTTEGEGKNGTVRYFEKATGHIYDIDLKTLTASRASNTTIPGIFETYWSKDGDQAIIRYIEKNETSVEDSVRNFSVLSIAATSTRGIFLLSSIRAIAASPKENRIFYLAPFEDTYVGMTASFEDKKQKQILIIPFGEFSAAWPSENLISLNTKPSAAAEGYLYKLNPSTGSLEGVLKGIRGLTALWSPDASFILYSESSFGGFRTGLYDAKEGSASQFSLLTLPEKCAWGAKQKGIIYCAVPLNVPSGSYPDDWYQGIVSFNDRIWKINISDGATEIISEQQINKVFDIINPFLDKNEEYFFFQNKIDGTLWSLKIQ